MGALANWKRSPAKYIDDEAEQRRRDSGSVAGVIHLQGEHLAGLGAEQLARGLSQLYRRRCQKMGEQWRLDLGRADLRHVSLQQLQRILKKYPVASHQKRQVVLLAICGWLTDQGLLEAAQSPARHLRLPPVRSASSVREMGYGAEHLQAVYAAVTSQGCRDVMRLQVCYGLHHSEVERVARVGKQASLSAVTGAGLIAGKAVFLHESGSPHPVSLDAAAWAAAQRLRARGRAPGQGSMYRQLRRASLKAGRAQVRAAQFRHSFVQLGQGGRWEYPSGQGVSIEALTLVTGHRGSATTRAHYSGTETRPMLVMPFELHHPDDPPVHSSSGAAAAGPA